MLNRLKDYLLTLGIVLLIVGLLQSCKHEPASINNLPTVCFSQIQPIFSNCGTCHKTNSEEGNIFDPKNPNSFRNLVKAGDPWGSKLYTIISSPNNPNMMPPKGKDNFPISEENRVKLELWILQGANMDSNCGTSINSK